MPTSMVVKRTHSRCSLAWERRGHRAPVVVLKGGAKRRLSLGLVLPDPRGRRGRVVLGRDGVLPSSSLPEQREVERADVTTSAAASNSAPDPMAPTRGTRHKNGLGLWPWRAAGVGGGEVRQRVVQDGVGGDETHCSSA